MHSQRRVSVDPACISASETTGAASADGKEILAGFIGFESLSAIRNAFGVSSDGGKSWAHVVVRPPTALQDAVEGDPMTAYDPRTGTLFAGGISRAKCIYVARKIPGQNAFSPSTVARQSDWPDKGWMAAGPKFNQPQTTRLYIAYNEGIVWSDDLGDSWVLPVSLGTGYGFLPRIGPNGILHLSYWDGWWGIMYRRSLDSGQTWSSANQIGTRMVSWGVQNYGIPGTFRNVTNNAFAVNPVDGSLITIFVDQTNVVSGQKNLDLYLLRSLDGGVTWGPATRLPFRPLDKISDMIFPWIEFTKNGRLHLFAMTTAYNPGQIDGTAHGLWDQAYAYSDDLGGNWSPLMRLTPSSWDSAFHNTGSADFLGDYQGIAMSEKSIFPVYPDTRTGEAEAYVNDVYDPIERASAFWWSLGTPVSGGLASIHKHDGKAATATASWTTGLGLATMAEASFPVPSASPTSMRVHLWAAASGINLQQRLELRNAATGAWEAVDVRPATLGLSLVSVVVPNPSKFVAAGVVRLRIIHKSVLRRPSKAYLSSVDQCVLLVEP